MGQNYSAERSCQVPGSKYTKCLELTEPFRYIRREKELSNDGGEKNKNDEVIEFKCASERSQR